MLAFHKRTQLYYLLVIGCYSFFMWLLFNGTANKVEYIAYSRSEAPLTCVYRLLYYMDYLWFWWYMTKPKYTCAEGDTVKYIVPTPMKCSQPYPRNARYHHTILVRLYRMERTKERILSTIKFWANKQNRHISRHFNGRRCRKARAIGAGRPW